MVPLACMNYLPASLILDRGEVPATLAPLLWATPAVGVVFLLVSLRIWRFGVKHYCSTGS